MNRKSFGKDTMMDNNNLVKRRKVVVVGAGAVGSTFCYALAQSGLAEEVAVIDRNDSLAQGQVLDLVHGQAFFPTVSIRVGNPCDYADAQVVVITAGAAQRPGETRLQLLQKNAAIVRSIANDIVDQKSAGVILVASNPVDILTHVALKRAGYDRGRVIGSGTVLDSARFRHLLSTYCGVDIHNVHAYILGEHGDSEFAAWSMTHIAGMQIDKYCPICRRCADWAAERRQVEQNVRDSAYHIIEYKGATCFAIGLALVRITGAILRGERSVLTVSTSLDGEFGLRDVCLSVPSIVSESGVVKIIESQLPERELAALTASASVLKKAMEQLDLDA
ncbi:MAG: L-lactate dehydrogenase [Anaerolineales bacterium]|nr:L-lactate dehydrogenase [Anaerolineales bacterium]